jgi:hypothetical protein
VALVKDYKVEVVGVELELISRQELSRVLSFSELFAAPPLRSPHRVLVCKGVVLDVGRDLIGWVDPCWIYKHVAVLSVPSSDLLFLGGPCGLSFYLRT